MYELAVIVIACVLLGALFCLGYALGRSQRQPGWRPPEPGFDVRLRMEEQDR